MAQRNTRQRQMVLDAVQARCDHPTADELYLDVRAQDGKVSRGTVYRNLGVLAASGQILQVASTPADRYDLRLDRHYHLHCTECGKVWDAPVAYAEGIDAEVERLTGFSVSRHDTVFEGLCEECRAKEAPGT